MNKTFKIGNKTSKLGTKLLNCEQNFKNWEQNFGNNFKKLETKLQHWYQNLSNFEQNFYNISLVPIFLSFSLVPEKKIPKKISPPSPHFKTFVCVVNTRLENLMFL